MEGLALKIFYDGTKISNFLNKEFIKGYTTNPTILNKGNIETKSYEKFAKSFIEQVGDKPVSFEVFSDDLEGMIEQGKIISNWGTNVYVKIPICNSKGEDTSSVINTLNKEGIKLNITAIFTKKQIKTAFDSLENKNIPTIISIFAGRISDTGQDAKDYIKYGVNLTKDFDKIEILWASVREVYNIFEACECNCHIITVPDNIMEKTNNIGKDLEQFSRETVLGFYNDSIKSGIKFS